MEGADLEVQQLYVQLETLQLRDGILYRNFVGTDGQVRWKQLLFPRSLRALLLQHLHAGPTAGHKGVKKMQNKVTKMAYWRRRVDVAMFCRRCIQCNHYRLGPGVRQGELQQATAGGPFTKIHVDLTVPHIRSNNGFVYLLTAVDYFTKYLICVPLRDKMALSGPQALVKHVCLLFGCPILQISDMDGEFQNDVMRNIVDLPGIQLNRTTAYRSSNDAI